MTTPDMLNQITATKVPTSQRPACLTKIYGARCTAVESAIFDVARSIISGYSGAYWDFYRLSNGGFFMVPCLGTKNLSTPVNERVRLQVAGNMFDGDMSEEAAGIICCLHAYSHASFAARDGSDYQQTLAEQFHLLRDFALDHPEAGAIFGAID
jgi:hypothetical protein